jgi:glyoxylase-like metal-dependent hydrolase (beta-lactamase superfamily II)
MQSFGGNYSKCINGWLALKHAYKVSYDLFSHWHWDHIGDPSSFPSTTELIVGQGFSDVMLPGYPSNPDSPIRESDYAYVC